MSQNVRHLKLRDWTRFPGGRYEQHGRYSGERYRTAIVEPAVGSGADIEVDLNGIFTVGWSFLDEAFGHYLPQFGEAEWRRRFRFLCEDDPDIYREIEYVVERRMGTGPNPRQS